MNNAASRELMSSENNGSQSCGVLHYLAAAFGGFLVGFVELLKNGTQSKNVTVLRISAVLQEYFSPHLSGGWVALVLLAIFGAFLCAIYKPGSPKESFALGLSVFAILTSIAPVQAPSGVSVSSPLQSSLFSFISAAYAENLNSGQMGDYYIEFRGDGLRAKNQKGLMSVYDSREKNLLLSIPVEIKKISKLKLPKGSYVLLFECDGCQSVRVDLTVDKLKDAAVVTLNDSSVPLSLQRLFRPSIVKFDDVSDRQLPFFLERYDAQIRQ